MKRTLLVFAALVQLVSSQQQQAPCGTCASVMGDVIGGSSSQKSCCKACPDATQAVAGFRSCDCADM
jgi:hypothetical protein